MDLAIIASSAGGVGVAAAESSSALEALSNLQGASLPQILSRHHEHVVRMALRSARDWTVDQAQKRAEMQLKEDWEDERKEILGRGVLGNRFMLRGAGGGLERREEGMMRLGGEVASSLPLLEEGTTALSSFATNIVPSPQVLPPNTEPLMKYHLETVERHLKTFPRIGSVLGSSYSPSISNAMALLTRLQEDIEVASSQPSSALKSESMSGYFNTLTLLKCIMKCCVSLGVEIASLSSNSGISDKFATVAAGVMGACSFFAHQYKNHVIEVVRESELSGFGGDSATLNGAALAALTPMARDVCSFAAIMAGNEVVQGRGGVWPRLFYCELDVYVKF